MRDAYSLLRRRADRDEAALTRLAVRPIAPGSPAFVGRVAPDARQATAAGSYFLVNPATVFGPEAEGGAATLVVDTATKVLVCVLGTNVPAVGDDLICRFVANRWVAERGGAATGTLGGGIATIPTCSCTAIPTTLTMSVSGPCTPGDFFACTLQWGPTPPEFSGLGLGANCFLSTGTFTEPASGLTFRHYLSCSFGTFRLARVFEPSSSGAAFVDTTLYSWSIPAPGNSCSPFLLSNGSIYPGGSPSCLVAISR